MICPNCSNNNAEFVEVENPLFWVENNGEFVGKGALHGIAVECLDCGLRGPGAFEKDDDDNNRLALEFWDAIIILDDAMRKKIKEHFAMAPTLTTDILDYLIWINKEQ
jgi:hypothetical protein